MINFDSKFEIKSRGLLDAENSVSLFDFYQPLIFSDGVYLYEFLVHEFKGNELKGKISDLVVLSGLSFERFLVAKKSLESVNLISTYTKKGSDLYYFVLNDALPAKDFLNHIVLSGLLKGTIGNERFEKLVKKYSHNIDLNGFEDVSAAISDSYQLNFEYDGTNIDGLVGRTKVHLKEDFSSAKLFKLLSKKYGILSSSFTKEEIAKIEHIAMLFGFNEEIMAQIVSSSFTLMNEYGSKFDEEKAKKLAEIQIKSRPKTVKRSNEKTELHSESDVAKQISYFESMSPFVFLKSKQNDIDVSQADAKIIDMLSYDFGFSNGMINALISYVLEVKDGELNKKYIEKIAATLVRKGCEDTLDVLENLYKFNVKNTYSDNEPKEEDTEIEIDPNDPDFEDF